MKMGISITPDMRYTNGAYLNLRGRLFWSPQTGVYKQQLVTLNLKVPTINWDFKKKFVKGNSLEAVAVRDRIFLIRDFVSKLNNSAEENIADLREFLGLTLKENEVQLVTLSDYVREFVRINEKRYSPHSLRKYNMLLNNLAFFKQHSGLRDNFHSMSKDKQTVYFSSFTDFLLFNEVKDDKGNVLKSKYENGTVKQQFSSIKSVTNKFNSTGVKVDLREFSDYLKEGNVQGTFCTIEEVDEIYSQRKTLQDLPQPERKSADLFLFQVFTGFRYNELKHVTASSITIKIINGHSFKSLNNIADKEGLTNSVPLNDICQEIIDRWKGLTSGAQLLPVLSEYQYNSNLHEFLKRIPMMHRVEKRVRYRGNDRVEEEVSRYLAITSHAGRHTYSHLLLKSGLRIEEVSKMMNHASPETTDKHYKHQLEDELQYKALGVLNKVI